MAAARLRCCVCRAPFYGRSDACYCSGACRQKAYRARIARQAFHEPDLHPPHDAAEHARQLRKRAQLARKAAISTRREAAALRRSRYR